MARLNVECLAARDLMSAGVAVVTGPVVDHFTPPIGSDKGSIVARIASDGLGTTGPAAVTIPTLDGGSKDAAYFQATQTQGIIAILIGLREPTGTPSGGIQK
jgi:hypothetical protein